MIIDVDQDGLLRFSRGKYGPILMAGDTELHSIGYDCDTCGAMFEQIDNYKTPLTPAEISRRFTEPMLTLDPDVVDSIKCLLPAGSYHVSLLQFMPCLHTTKGLASENGPPEVRDYRFTGRKITIDRPSIQQYFSNNELGETVMTKRVVMEPHFESEEIIPHRDYGSIDWERVFQFAGSKGDDHTALVLSMGEGRSPGGKSSSVRLTHFLLDGHHKLLAADQRSRSIQLLSFFNLTETRYPLDRFMVRHPDEFADHRLSIEDSYQLWCQQQLRLLEQLKSNLHSEPPPTLF